MKRNLLAWFVVAFALTLGQSSFADQCPNKTTLDHLPKAGCTIGDMTFAKFDAKGGMATGGDIEDEDISVNWTWDDKNSLATIIFGFSGRGTAVLSAGKGEEAIATIRYKVAAGTNRKLTSGLIDMSDTVAHTGKAKVDEDIAGKFFLQATDEILTDNIHTRTNNSPQRLNAATITVEDIVTTMGGIAQDGSADIVSISVSFSDTNCPDVNTVPQALLKDVGAQYYLAFVSAGERNALSDKIEDYNAFVQKQADMCDQLKGITWQAVASTPKESAEKNLALKDDPPIYLLDGKTRVVAAASDLFPATN